MVFKIAKNNPVVANNITALLVGILVVLLFLLYFSLYLFKGYDSKRELQVIIVLFCHCILFSQVIIRQYFACLSSISIISRFFLGLFFLSGFIAAILSQYIFYALGDWLHVLLLLNTALILMAVIRVFPPVKKVFFVVMVVGFITITIHFFVNCLIAIAIGDELLPNAIYPNFGNIRFINQFHVQLFFLFVAASTHLPRIVHKYMILLGGVGIFMLLIGGARGALLSLFSVILICYVLQARNKCLALITKRLLSMVVCGIFIYLVYIYYESTLASANYLLRVGGSGRLDMWLETAVKILSEPLGIGSYHYATVTVKNIFSHPHNSILQFTLEWGWAAGASLCVLMLALFFYIVKILLCEKCLIKIALACSLLVAMAYSLLSGVFVMPVSQVTFMFLLALLFAWDKLGTISFCKERECSSVLEQDQITDKSFKSSTVLIFHGLILVVSCMYSVYAYKSYENYSLLGSEIYPISLGARMWLIGGIVDIGRNNL